MSDKVVLSLLLGGAVGTSTSMVVVRVVLVVVTSPSFLFSF